MARITQIQVRRDTAANWVSVNPTLVAGEHGFETDTGKFKIGTGSTAWNSLTYAADASKITGATLSTSVTSATGITSVGTLGSLSVTGTVSAGTFTGNGAAITSLNAGNLSGTVAIANGGTGATTAALARTALGVAASGANSDITSITGLTTVLSLAQGGTGLSFNDKTLVGKGSQLSTVTGSATGGVMTNAFQDAGTPKYISVDSASIYYFEAYMPITKTASASSGAWQASILYQDTSGNNLSPVALYTAINAWSGGTVDTSVTTASANTAVSFGTAGTTSGTKYMRLVGYITTHSSTAGRMSIGFGQSQNASSGTPSTGTNAYIAVYKMNTGTDSRVGNWV